MVPGHCQPPTHRRDVGQAVSEATGSEEDAETPATPRLLGGLPFRTDKVLQLQTLPVSSISSTALQTHAPPICTLAEM